MSEILSFEEFVSKHNEARAVIKDYVIDCYIKKVKEKLLEKNPGISQRQLKMKTRQARDSFKDSAKCRELMEAVPLENVSKSLRKAYDTYCEATKKFIAYEKMKKDVVEAIPEQIKDAYPKARLLRRKFILHIGPTNSGKTFAALEKFREAREAVYLAPLRLLALEVYENTNYAGVDCSLLTGEEEAFIEGASHVAETIEMADMNKRYDVAVIDECQMIADEGRGGAWTAAILGLCADEIHICMAPHAEDIVKRLIEYCGDEIVEIDRRERMTPLELDPDNCRFPDIVKPGDALIVFSKRSVINVAAELQGKGIECSMIYGALPYETRKAETERFLNGETKIVVATDAIGMGLNLPIKRVVFLETEKYDGYEMRLLKPEEVQQIAGRAGRKGIYEEGRFTACGGRKFIRQSMKMSPEEIDFARIRFPGFLVAVEGKLSGVMKRWNELETESLFLKTDIDQQIDLCLWLENHSDDKETIYRLINIPFNEKNDDILFLWKTLALRVAAENNIDLTREIEALAREKKRISGMTDTSQHIQQLEFLYQKYDLVHNFIRLFGKLDTRDANKELLRKKKKEVSDELTAILKKKKLKRRQCSSCGRFLPYNYPYGMCSDCYEEMQARRYNRYYGYYGYGDFEDY